MRVATTAADRGEAAARSDAGEETLFISATGCGARRLPTQTTTTTRWPDSRCVKTARATRSCTDDDGQLEAVAGRSETAAARRGGAPETTAGL
jgi:hypothetical protein